MQKMVKMRVKEDAQIQTVLMCVFFLRNPCSIIEANVWMAGCVRL